MLLYWIMVLFTFSFACGLDANSEKDQSFKEITVLVGLSIIWPISLGFLLAFIFNKRMKDKE